MDKDVFINFKAMGLVINNNSKGYEFYFIYYFEPEILVFIGYYGYPIYIEENAWDVCLAAVPLGNYLLFFIRVSRVLYIG